MILKIKQKKNLGLMNKLENNVVLSTVLVNRDKLELMTAMFDMEN